MTVDDEATKSQLPYLPGLEHAEPIGWDLRRRARRDQRPFGRVDRLIGEMEGAVMMGERELGAAIEERLDGFGGIHVLVAHEPARLVSADGQHRQTERP